MDGTHHLHFTGGSFGIAAAGAVGLALTGRIGCRWDGMGWDGMDVFEPTER